MYLQEVAIKNFRRIEDACVRIDESETLIVGRNNSGKTSLLDFIEMTLASKRLQYSDFPLRKRKEMHRLFKDFIEEKISYEELCEHFPYSTIEYHINYEEENEDESLGFLSPFIIDVDADIALAIIRAVYRFRASESDLQSTFEGCFEGTGKTIDLDELKHVCKEKFSTLFHLKVYAVNPSQEEDCQERPQSDLANLFPYKLITAERDLGEDEKRRNSSLDKLIASFFNADEGAFEEDVLERIKTLRRTIGDANRDIQRNSDELLSQLVEAAVGFGYPDPDTGELSLAVLTQLNIDDLLKTNTELAAKV